MLSLQASDASVSQRSASRPTALHDTRGAHIIAKTIYRELRSSGMDERDVMAVATSLLGMVAEELRES